MRNILVINGADFSGARIGTRTVPEEMKSNGLYFKYIDSYVDVESVELAIKTSNLTNIIVSGYPSLVNIDTEAEYRTYFDSIEHLKNKIIVTAFFNDGTYQVVSKSAYTIDTSSNLSSEGKKTFTVSYVHNSITKTSTFNITYEYKYFNILKSGLENVSSIIEMIDNVQQTSLVTSIRYGHDYSVTITADENITAIVNGTLYTAKKITFSIDNVRNDITVVVNKALQSQTVLQSELETPLYITANESNSKLRLEFNIVNPQYSFSQFVSYLDIEKLQYSKTGNDNDWHNFTYVLDNGSYYSNTVSLQNIGDKVYIRAEHEMNRTGISLVNVASTITKTANHTENSVPMYYKFSYDDDNIYAYSSSISNYGYYTYSLDSGMNTSVDQRFITINVVKDDNSNADFSAGGNIMSLLYGGDKFKNKTEFPGVDELLLAGKTQDEIIDTISHSVYFKNSGGFSGLFRNTNITKLPEIHAKYLPTFSLSNFALNCERLSDLSDFSMTLIHCADWSCRSMFSGCTNMTKLPHINGEYSASYGALYGMFSSVNNNVTNENDKIKDWTSINLPTTVSYMTCATMFSGCKNMEKSPVIVAEPLTPNSCVRMFLNCTSLNDITITSTTNEKRKKPSNSLILYGLGTPASSSAAYRGWLYCDNFMTSIGTIHIKKSLLDNGIPESTTALTNTSTENAKKYHAAGLPYYKSGNNVLPWNVEII